MPQPLQPPPQPLQPHQMHPRRENTRRYLERNVPALSPNDVHDVEIGIFNAALHISGAKFVPCQWNNPRFEAIYAHKARSVAANLDPNTYVGNDRLNARLADGEFIAHQLATMHSDHIYPERWSEVTQAKLQRDEYISNAKPVAMTDQFRCARCKKRECSFMEMQTRSCDEPATLFISCLVCGNRWRLG